MSKGQYGKGCSDTKKDLYPVIDQRTAERNTAIAIVIAETLTISAIGAYKFIQHLKNKKRKRP